MLTLPSARAAMHIYEIRPRKHKGGVDRGVAVLMSMRSIGLRTQS